MSADVDRSALAILRAAHVARSGCFDALKHANASSPGTLAYENVEILAAAAIHRGIAYVQHSAIGQQPRQGKLGIAPERKCKRKPYKTAGGSGAAPGGHLYKPLVNRLISDSPMEQVHCLVSDEVSLMFSCSL